MDTTIRRATTTDIIKDFTIRRATTTDILEWLRMRMQLWPHLTAEDLECDMTDMLADPEQAVFVAVRPDGCPSTGSGRRLGGFVEASTRKYADGCETSPVGYIEGWYVDADLRGNGVGAALIRASEDWARGIGCQEMASDTWLDNDASIEAHKKLGYEEIERLVHFAKRLI